MSAWVPGGEVPTDQLLVLRFPYNQTSSSMSVIIEKDNVHIPREEPAYYFDVTMLVYGDPILLNLRLSRLEGNRAQQEFKVSFNDSGTNVWNLTEPLNTTKVMEMFALTHTNSFTSTVCDCIIDHGYPWSCGLLNKYVYFVDLLMATQTGYKSNSSAYEGTRLNLWLGLYPPSEALSTNCMPPRYDDPRTNANETLIFLNKTYIDYTAWALLAGLLAQQFPQLVAMNIDGKR